MALESSQARWNSELLAAEIGPRITVSRSSNYPLMVIDSTTFVDNHGNRSKELGAFKKMFVFDSPVNNKNGTLWIGTAF